MFQFTLPHGERPSPATPSIPAPSFNSRSRMGSDRQSSLLTRSPACFNSRSRMGSDSAVTVSRVTRQRFQFTLPHGERPTFPARRRLSSSFNSRSRMGSDSTITEREPASPGFNSRSRMGSDRRREACADRRGRFNSRSRMGSDTVSPALLFGQGGFNTRSRMGSDRRRRQVGNLPPVSIHAPAWGATLPPR